ncbi:hypothetical protein ACROYT_G016326 [Oculina patagonica]
MTGLWTGPWTLDSGLWTLDSGLWTLDSGLWTLDSGLWTLDSGLWTLDSGLWTLDSGLWTLDSGLWTLMLPSFVLLESSKKYSRKKEKGISFRTIPDGENQPLTHHISQNDIGHIVEGSG